MLINVGQPTCGIAVKADVHSHPCHHLNQELGSLLQTLTIRHLAGTIYICSHRAVFSRLARRTSLPIWRFHMTRTLDDMDIASALPVPSATWDTGAQH